MNSIIYTDNFNKLNEYLNKLYFIIINYNYNKYNINIMNIKIFDKNFNLYSLDKIINEIDKKILEFDYNKNIINNDKIIYSNNFNLLNNYIKCLAQLIKESNLNINIMDIKIFDENFNLYSINLIKRDINILIQKHNK